MINKLSSKSGYTPNAIRCYLFNFLAMGFLVFAGVFFYIKVILITCLCLVVLSFALASFFGMADYR